MYLLSTFVCVCVCKLLFPERMLPWRLRRNPQKDGKTMRGSDTKTEKKKDVTGAQKNNNHTTEENYLFNTPRIFIQT